MQGKPFKPFPESIVVLKGKNGGGNQDCHLFAVGYRFKSSPDGYLGLPESHISAYQPVHGESSFHSGLYIGCGLQLVGGILIDKGGFQFLLQVGVGRKGKSLLIFSLCIEQDQFPGNVLYLLLGIAFQLLPGTATQFIDLWVVLYPFPCTLEMR